MKVTKYEQQNIKGSSVNLTIGEVTLLTGPNRSSKTSRLEGIALAATGRSSFGATPAKLAELIGPSGDQASAKITLDDGQESQWNILQSARGGKISNSAKHDGPDVFGPFIAPQDFWNMTGEEKWRTIGGLVTGNSQEVEATAQTIYRDTGIKQRGSDLLSQLSNLQADLKSRINMLNQQCTQAAQSLVPPEEYTGKPLRDLLRDRAEVERFVDDQTKARKTQREREERKTRREKDLATLRETEKNARVIACENQATAESLRQFATQIRPLSQQVADQIRNESQVVAQCRITPIGQTLNNSLSHCVKIIASAKDVPIPARTTTTAVSVIGDNLSAAIEALSHCLEVLQEQGTLLSLDETLPAPAQIAQIDEILDAAPTKWRPKAIDEYTSADAFLTHDINVVESAQRKMEATAAGAQAEIARLEAQEAIDQATSVEVCTQEAFVEKLSHLDSLNKLISVAQQWPEYLARQESVANELSQLKLEADKLNGYSAMIRKLREQLLQAASSPVEQAANKLVVACGYEPLELAVTSTEKTSSLSVHTASGVDLSVMCGAERVIYGLAILLAIQSLSAAPCPLRLIECAELDADTLSKLLEALVQFGAKGNTILASWVTPPQLPQGVVVIDCATQGISLPALNQNPAAPSPSH